MGFEEEIVMTSWKNARGGIIDVIESFWEEKKLSGVGGYLILSFKSQTNARYYRRVLRKITDSRGDFEHIWHLLVSKSGLIIGQINKKKLLACICVFWEEKNGLSGLSICGTSWQHNQNWYRRKKSKKAWYCICVLKEKWTRRSGNPRRSLPKS